MLISVLEINNSLQNKDEISLLKEKKKIINRLFVMETEIISQYVRLDDSMFQFSKVSMI